MMQTASVGMSNCADVFIEIRCRPVSPVARYGVISVPLSGDVSSAVLKKVM
ncbi:MAG: hypothetical protein J6V72_01535 [Kiritimatiellae bacterium]|nr:hypothetical protein [Kiritimatiellia bacterium]